MNQVVLTIGLTCTMTFMAANCSCQEQNQKESRRFNPKIVLSKPIRPIIDAPFIPGADASAEVVTDNELVLGVVIDGESRAYPINMITGPRREIVNDKLGGLAIAATW